MACSKFVLGGIWGLRCCDHEGGALGRQLNQRCKGGNGGGSRGGGEGGYEVSLKEGKGGVRGGNDACVVVISGSGMDVRGGSVHGGRRSEDVVGRGVGKRYCCTLPDEFRERWEWLPCSVKFNFNFNVVFLFGLEWKRSGWWLSCLVTSV